MSEQESGAESKAHLLDKLYRLYLAGLTKTDFEPKAASLARAVVLARTLERLSTAGASAEELAAALVKAKADAGTISNVPSTGVITSPASWAPAPYPGHG